MAVCYNVFKRIFAYLGILIIFYQRLYYIYLVSNYNSKWQWASRYLVHINFLILPNNLNNRTFGVLHARGRLKKNEPDYIII